MRSRRLLWVTMWLVVAGVGLAGCRSAPVLDQAVAHPQHHLTVRIGGKDFTEQHLLVKISALLLKDRGYQVEETVNMRTLHLRDALLRRHIDLYWEYTGTTLAVAHRQPALPDPDMAYEAAHRLDAAAGISWLNRTGFNNTYTIMMRSEHAARLGIRTVSQLAEHLRQVGNVLVAVDHEFAVRPDGLAALQEHYGFRLRSEQVRRMHASLVYQALQEGRVDVADGFATDGRIGAYGLVNLEDDRHFFPAYNAAPVVRDTHISSYPGVAAVLNEIGPRLDQKAMTQLISMVDLEHQDVTQVARQWLMQEGLINTSGKNPR